MFFLIAHAATDVVPVVIVHILSWSFGIAG
jgi:hypothetical protein